MRKIHEREKEESKFSGNYPYRPIERFNFLSKKVKKMKRNFKRGKKNERKKKMNDKLSQIKAKALENAAMLLCTLFEVESFF